MGDKDSSGALTLAGTPIAFTRTSTGASSGAAKNKIIPLIFEDPVVSFVVGETTGESLAASGSLPC